MNNELDYFKFYETISEKRHVVIASANPDTYGENITRQINGNSNELHKNVVLITIESYSGEF